MRAEDITDIDFRKLDPNTGFPLFGPVRVLSMGMPGLAGMRQDIVRILGIEKTNALLRRNGYTVGMGTANIARDMFDFDSLEDWLRAGSALRRLAGYANEELTHVEIDRNAHKVKFAGTWKESFEAAMWEEHFGRSREPVCTLLAGGLSGFASVVFGKEVLVKEVRCQAQGHDCCEFEGRSAGQWGMTPEEFSNFFRVDPFHEMLDNLKKRLDQANRELAQKQLEIQTLESRSKVSGTRGLIFRSRGMERVVELLERVAPTSSTVLLQGESGTGKELLARLVHQSSERSYRPFVAVNCASLPLGLLESELFGYKKGAFTGADKNRDGLFVRAGQGTLFLDEIGEVPMELQAKLLRALQEKEVRPLGGADPVGVEARVVAATNQKLLDMVEKGTFREDLYYRLAVFPVQVPPLRERKEDIMALARHFMGRFSPGHPGFSPEAVGVMEAHDWPGNVRELENWVEHALILAGENRVEPRDFPHASRVRAKENGGNFFNGLPSLKELEKNYTAHVLESCGGNKAQTARILGVSPATLWRRLKEKS